MPNLDLLKQFTENELQAALNDAIENRHTRENEELDRQKALVLKHIDVLLELVPKHDRTSCSDENPFNGTSDAASYRHSCERCQLLRIKNRDWNSDHTVHIEVVYSPNHDT